MAGVEQAIANLQFVAYEAMLFAAIGYLVGGFDDLLVDLLYLLRRLLSWLGLQDRKRDMPPGPPVVHGPHYFAILVPAWDEAAVIGAMLRTALARLGDASYRIYVGAYPNDRATIAAISDVAAGDARVVLAIGDRAGPTTKADCLNTLWQALLIDEAAGAPRASAIVLHDAEDLVDAGELRVFAHHLPAADVVQLPVLPLVDPASRFVAGHYLDEFAESHAKTQLVRQALGAALPLAGTGFAVRRDMVDRIAASRGGAPFDPTSLVEDYELGLTIAAMGGRAVFARAVARPGGAPIAVRAFFPGTLDAAIRQKARWMLGIALAGWDRTGWGRTLNPGDHWMRMRDRRALIAVLVLAAAYLALALWGVLAVLRWALGLPQPALPPAVDALLAANLALLAWRIAVRMAFVGRAYGRTEALLSVPRIFVANLIALMAARIALWRYLGLLRGARLRWDKTAHHFPDGAAIDRVA
ncbi:glycosyl transferase family protein [Sphingomonas baiyangensis]|uniref:Glycosyl transferase family protein n=1 Tax=Sphingomonas baiyangensis TaxID=2572576 RepID=A0A4U1L7M5_9SPHN|nr:glycosyl transferase family protein [Sphingomonas baiyangensis]TKD52921.1 glycosyl transferase family protein [Sphingomonas baiyangensis]